MKKFSSVVAIALVLSMFVGSAAFAAETNAASDEIAVSEVAQIADVDAVAEEIAADGTVDASAEEIAEVLTEAQIAQQRVAGMTQKVKSRGVYEITCSTDMFLLISQGYTKTSLDGPISITKGVLNYNDLFKKKKEVYVVCLSGTDTNILNQSTNWITDLLSGFEFDNLYVKNIKNAMNQAIPAGANVIVTGHSLGGMVAQQIAADSQIKAKYNILNTVTFGSPLVNAGSREGTVKRLGDTSDPVPYLSVNTFKHIIWQTVGLNRENGGYSMTDFSFPAHCISYGRTDVWGKYDPTGVKGGKKTLTLDFGTTKFFKSPIVVTR